MVNQKLEEIKKLDFKKVLKEYNPDLSGELLLSEDRNRYTMFPIKLPEVFKAYKNAVSVFWVVEDVPLGQDLNDWNNKLNENERYFIKNVLAFFAGSDGIVLENLVERFFNDLKHPEIRAFYAFQEAIETVHSEMYSLMIDTYISDEKEKNHLFNAIENVPAIKKKAEWAQKWIADKESSFPIRALAFSVVEGIFFSGSFCAIYWLKKRNLMPGLTLSNEFISRDEGTHVDFAVLLYNMLSEGVRVPEHIVYCMFNEAIEIETEFIVESIKCSMIGMNSKLMSQYLRFVADSLLVKLRYDKLYNESNPFEFMELIGLDRKTNFFESRNSSYNKANATKPRSNENEELKFDEDF